MYFQTKTLNCRVYASVVMLTCFMMFFQHDIHGCLTGNREVAGWVINSAVDMIGRWHEQSKGEESELGRWVAAPTCKCFLSVKAGEVSGMNQSARTSCFDSLAGLGKVSSCNVIFTMQWSSFKKFLRTCLLVLFFFMVHLCMSFPWCSDFHNLKIVTY